MLPKTGHYHRQVEHTTGNVTQRYFRGQNILKVRAFYSNDHLRRDAQSFVCS